MSTAFLILTIVFIIAVIKVKPPIKGTVALAGVLINSVISSWIAGQALAGSSFYEVWRGGPVFGDIPLRLDALSAWFVLVTNFTAITSILYGRQYLAHYNSRPSDLGMHYANYVLNHAALTGIYFIQNSLAFLCAWEIMALTSFVMVIHDHGRIDTLKAGINYLIQSHVSIILLTLAFIWIYTRTGSLDFESILTYCNSAGKEASLVMFLVFFAGFGIKAGFVPFHTWLPYAHPAAPSHVSGLMSGIIIKSGIYGIMRIIVLMPDNKLAIGYIILVISVISGIYGVMLAIVQHNLKKLLAYHSIENIGIIGIGIGIGAIGTGIGNPVMAFAGYAGALLHTLNHSLFKSLLFFTAGNVYNALHTLSIDRMGGLIKHMPRTAVLFLVAALAICGLPPFNGFISEFLIYSGLFHAVSNNQYAITSILAIAGLALIGGLAILCFTKAFGIIFLGNLRHDPGYLPQEVNKSTLFPKYMIVALIILIGLFPGIFLSALQKPVALFGATPEVLLNNSTIGLMQHISIAGWSFVALIAGIYFVRLRALKNRPVTNGPTWGCGFETASQKLQYTATSFAGSYSGIIKPLVRINKTEDVICDVVPQPVKSETHFHDKVEIGLIEVPTRRLRGFLGRFRFLQNGRVQFYVLYGVVFIGISILIPLIIDGIKALFVILKNL